MSLRRAAAKIQEHIADADLLVTHSGAHDTEFLDRCGVSVTGKLMFDTQILATVLLPDGPPLYSLKRLLEDLEIKFDENLDAVRTLKSPTNCLCKMEARSPLVTQEIPSHNSFRGISIPIN